MPYHLIATRFAHSSCFLGVAIAGIFGLCCGLDAIVGGVSWPPVAFDWNTKVRRKRPIRTHTFSVRLGSILHPYPSFGPALTLESRREQTASVKNAPRDFRRREPQFFVASFGARALKMFSDASTWKPDCFRRKREFHSARRSAVLCGLLFAVSASGGFLCSPARAQQADPATPVVVQPGAPGQPSRTLPSSTRATPPPRSQADVEFMQGMIMHHSQAVEMTALIQSHTENKDLRTLGARISSSQSGEIKFMRRWLAARGEALSMPTPGMPNMDMSREPMALMPGMLTAEQMEALRNAKGDDFDRLFLTGMIQHHNGALTMVKDLFDTAGAGQDADLFNFATDADNTQRAEIRIMQTMLEKEPLEEKR
jgi:uncharacterized protein (DUF305 family)